MNPGESPDDQPDRSVQRNIDYVLQEGQNNWSAYRDDPTEGQTGGTRKLRKAMLALCAQLDADPGCIPTSTLVFARSPNQAALKNFEASAQHCWRFHQAVIEALDIRVIICASVEVGRWVRTQLAWNVMGHGTEQVPDKPKNQPAILLYKAKSNAISVFELPHPSRFSWQRLETDLTELVQAVVNLCKVA